MKIAFFSDVHGNQYAFKAFLCSIREKQPDFVVFGGDIFGYYYASHEILEYMKTSGFICLLGNHDKYIMDLVDEKITEAFLVEKYGLSYSGILYKLTDDDIGFLKSLRAQVELNIDGLSIYFAHGSVNDPLNGRIYPDNTMQEFLTCKQYDFIFLGHTHHKMWNRINEKVNVINPGSIGQQRDGNGCSYVIFDTVKQNVEYVIVDYDKSALIQEVISNNENPVMEARLVEVINRHRNVEIPTSPIDLILKG